MAKILQINILDESIRTSYYIGHRILDVINLSLNEDTVSGIVEVDEFTLDKIKDLLINVATKETCIKINTIKIDM